jgi:hypothetical protein
MKGPDRMGFIFWFGILVCREGDGHIQLSSRPLRCEHTRLLYNFRWDVNAKPESIGYTAVMKPPRWYLCLRLAGLWFYPDLSIAMGTAMYDIDSLAVLR